MSKENLLSWLLLRMLTKSWLYYNENDLIINLTKQEKFKPELETTNIFVRPRGKPRKNYFNLVFKIDKHSQIVEKFVN